METVAPTKIRDNLYISGIHSVTQCSLDGITHVIGACQDSAEDNVSCSYEHFPMTDGKPQGWVPGDPSYALFEEAADALMQALDFNETVLVHCHAGRSRSAALCITVLCVMEGREYEEVYDEVKSIRPQIHPNNRLEKYSKRYIESWL